MLISNKPNEEMMKIYRIICLFCLFCTFSLFLPSVLAASSGGFSGDTDLRFTGTSSSTSTYYQDAISPNTETAIQLCGDGSDDFVGGFYAVNVSGTWTSVLVTYNDFSNALAPLTIDDGGGCFSTTGAALTVSPSVLATPNPDVKYAAFPGNLWIGYESSSQNPGTISNYVFGGTSAELEGSYTSVPRSFSQTTRDVTISTPTIQWIGDGTTFSLSASSSTHGVSTDRNMVIGICDDTQGADCSAGSLIDSSGDFPLTLSSGLSAGQVNDQNTYTKYAVVNGLDHSFCIGANLQASVSIGPNPIYYSQTLSMNASISNPSSSNDANGGNVDVTSSFVVQVVIYNTSNSAQRLYAQNISVGSNVIAGGNIQLSELTWDAFAHSGSYTVEVTADIDGQIAECNEGDNTASSTFTLLPITLPDIYIDGALNSNYTFDYPNVPYNLTFTFKNSDNDTLSNATVNLTEINGLTLLTPTQIYNRSISSSDTVTDGIQSKTEVSFTTDYGGNSSFTFIPTYNSLYLSIYNYTNLSSYIGNYNLYLTGTQSDGQSFQFSVNGSIVNNLTFSFAQPEYTGTYADKNLPYESIVAQVLDFVYNTYTNFLETVV